MALIRLYKNENLGGRNIPVNHNIENLKNYGFNDETSSCHVEDGTWMLYKDANFQGKVSILSTGVYGSPKAMGLSNDSLTSLRQFPEVVGPTLLLFKDEGFRGRMALFTGAESNFKGINFNDQVSSAIVLKGTWKLFKNADFSGTSWTVSANGGPRKDGRYPTPSPFENDAISSVRPK